MGKNNLYWVFLLLILGSCSMFEHRDFESEMTFDTFNGPMFLPNRDFEAVAGDNGRYYYNEPEIIKNRVPATEYEKEQTDYQLSLRIELQNIENGLSDAEYAQYVEVRNKFSNNSERIYFLTMSASRRREYLAARGIGQADAQYSNYAVSRRPVMRRPAAMPSVLDGGENDYDAVSLGMDKEDVTNILGPPDRQEFAGNRKYGNMRWTYTQNGKIRKIYFENGTVEGWTQDD